MLSQLGKYGIFRFLKDAKSRIPHVCRKSPMSLNSRQFPYLSICNIFRAKNRLETTITDQIIQERKIATFKAEKSTQSVFTQVKVQYKGITNSKEYHNMMVKFEESSRFGTLLK